MINVEVAYAGLAQQAVIVLQLAEGATAELAIQQSGLLQQYPEIDLTSHKIGIFSKIVSLQAILQEGDRVEIYRPLLIDPKQVRVQRAAHFPVGRQLKRGQKI